MKLTIPKRCEIRWKAALAVLEDLQEDIDAPFDMGGWADLETLWEKKNGCGSAACFGGYISVSPYCRALGYPRHDYGSKASSWLLGRESDELYMPLFYQYIDAGSRVKTLAFLKRRLKAIFRASTGRKLVAPLTFYY